MIRSRWVLISLLTPLVPIVVYCAKAFLWTGGAEGWGILIASLRAAIAAGLVGALCAIKNLLSSQREVLAIVGLIINLGMLGLVSLSYLL